MRNTSAHPEFVTTCSGTQVNDDFLAKLVGSDDDDYPKLGPNTTETDLTEALFVKNNPACTRWDLELFRLEESLDDNDVAACRELRNSDLVKGEKREDEMVISSIAARMKEKIRESSEKTSAKMRDEGGDGMDLDMCKFRPINEEIFDMRKGWVDALDDLTEDTRVDYNMLKDLDLEIWAAIDRVREKVDEKWGQNGGGEGVMEWYGTTGDRFEKNKKRHRGPYN